MYFVQCLFEGRFYTYEASSLSEALDLADVFICQGGNPVITKGE